MDAAAAPVSSDQILERAFTRTTGARATRGNRVTLLRDARENYPRWLQAIAAAERTIHFETYIIRDDKSGREFAEALKAKAAAGVRVRLMYDWWGVRGASGWRFWRDLRKAGVDVRCFNPLRLDSPFSWVNRDHRKCITIDGRVAFVSGLCVGDQWTGDPARGLEPWRDTGVMVEGPAVKDVERAFARSWGAAGAPLPDDEFVPSALSPASPGDAVLRVVATEPADGGLFRLDQMVVAAAERSLWLTDAYFVAVSSYVQTLSAAARDGVDVRLLVPSATDVPGLRALARSGFRSLLEAGVRVFEWNGVMLHAKTAVADGRWARVGSTNLNPASWLGNWELDVAVENREFSLAMEAMYREDLQNATEIVLSERRRVRPASAKPPRPQPRQGRGRSAAAGAIGAGSTVGAAITNRRLLGPAEARVIGTGGAILLAIAVTMFVFPRFYAITIGVGAAWIALTLLLRALKLHRVGQRPPPSKRGG